MQYAISALLAICTPLQVEIPGPIVIQPATHPPRAIASHHQAVTTSDDLLRQACPIEWQKSNGIIQSSFGEANLTVYPLGNGLVRTAVEAYSNHHHLTIRPEDVWFSILTQVSFYVNAHAEELRTFFVSHDGQKTLKVTDVGTIYSVDIGALVVRLTKEIQKNVKDPESEKWIMPDFTTTTPSDMATAAVLFMGAMQSYFSYEMTMICGLPSVTLLGEKSDWISIRRRIDKLDQLGEEPRLLASLLRPILDHFVLSFEDPTDPLVVDFWQRTAHEDNNMSGITYLSGWITAFCFWGVDGKRINNMPQRLDTAEDIGSSHASGIASINLSEFPLIDIKDIPAGFASVPVYVNDNGVEHYTRIVAGSVGMKAWSSGQRVDVTRGHHDEDLIEIGSSGGHQRVIWEHELGDKTALDSVQPVSGWWMYETEKPGDQ